MKENIDILTKKIKNCKQLKLNKQGMKLPTNTGREANNKVSKFLSEVALPPLPEKPL
jgi:hypothetical protein